MAKFKVFNQCIITTEAELDLDIEDEKLINEAINSKWNNLNFKETGKELLETWWEKCNE